MGAHGARPRRTDDLRGRAGLTSPPTLTSVAKLAALDQVLNAVAHPARRQILLTLHFRGGTATAGELAARFEHAWPTTTRHLLVLEDTGLLQHERASRTRVYQLDRERLALIDEWLGWFET